MMACPWISEQYCLRYVLDCGQRAVVGAHLDPLVEELLQPVRAIEKHSWTGDSATCEHSRVHRAHAGDAARYLSNSRPVLRARPPVTRCPPSTRRWRKRSGQRRSRAARRTGGSGHRQLQRVVEAAGHDRDLGAEPALDLVGDREGEQEVPTAGTNVFGDREDRAESCLPDGRDPRRQVRVEQVGIPDEHGVEECGLINRSTSATDERCGGTATELLGVRADGPISSPSSAPAAQAMLSSTFRFSVRIVPTLISAVVAPTTKSAISSTMCLCVMALVKCARAAASTTKRLPVVRQTSHRRSRTRGWRGVGRLPAPTIGRPEQCASSCFPRKPRETRQRAARQDGRRWRGAAATRSTPEPDRSPGMPQPRRGRRGVPFRRLEDRHAQSTHVRVEGIAGDTAVIDFGDACSGVGGEFLAETVPGRPCGIAGIDQHGDAGGRHRLRRTGPDGVKRLGSDQMSCQPACFGATLV